MTEIPETLEERCKRLVDREILANQTLLVNEVLKLEYYTTHTQLKDLDLPTYEDIENYIARLDLNDLIRDNLDEFVGWLLDWNNTVLSDWYSDEHDEFEKQIELGMLKTDDMDDPDDNSGFWSWLQDHAPFSDEEDEIRMTRDELLLDIELREDDEKESLYEYFQDHGVEIEDNASEIFSWYLVTGWLAEKLQAKGEAILHWANQAWWGRRTYGQLIMDDGVIQKIVKDLYGNQDNPTES